MQVVAGASTLESPVRAYRQTHRVPAYLHDSNSDRMGIKADQLTTSIIPSVCSQLPLISTCLL